MSVIEEENELLKMSGGTSVSSSLINAFVNGAKIILELGRSLGSALRRTTSKRLC